MEPSLRVDQQRTNSFRGVSVEPPEVEYLRNFREIGLVPYRGISVAELATILDRLAEHDGKPVSITRAKGFLDGSPVHIVRTDRGLVADPAPERSAHAGPSGYANHVWIRSTDPKLALCGRYFAEKLGTPRFPDPQVRPGSPAPSDLEMQELGDYLGNLRFVAAKDPVRAETLLKTGAAMLARFLDRQTELIKGSGSLTAYEQLDLAFLALSVAVHPSFDPLFAENRITAPLASADEQFWAANPYGLMHKAFLAAGELRLSGESFLYDANAAMLGHIVKRGVEGGYLSTEQVSSLREQVQARLAVSNASWERFYEGLR